MTNKQGHCYKIHNAS